jgi:hypothetical protein
MGAAGRAYAQTAFDIVTIASPFESLLSAPARPRTAPLGALVQGAAAR